MRVAFECYAIYSAVLCVILCFALALNLEHDKIEWVARICINASFMLYGPIMFSLSLFGCYYYKPIMSVCLVNGIAPGTNHVNLFILFVAMFFSVMVCLCMAFEQTVDMARVAFTNEESLLFRITTMYFHYQVRLR